LRGRKRIYFVPMGALSLVPFVALPGQDAGHENILADRFDVALTPAVRFIASARPNVRKNASVERRALLVADPVYDPNDPRIAARSPESSTTLRRVSGTIGDIAGFDALTGRYRVDRLIGVRATRQGFLGAALNSYDVMHLATHAVVDFERPLLSEISLSRLDLGGRPRSGSIRISDIRARSLNARLVFLASCESALGSNIEGEGMLGLSSAFMAAGSDSVVSSLWRVPDKETGRLVRYFYVSYATSGDAVASLAVAIRKYRAASRMGTNPYFWAAFSASVRRAN
jgi:CHAT domain-containing protein